MLKDHASRDVDITNAKMRHPGLRRDPTSWARGSGVLGRGRRGGGTTWNLRTQIETMRRELQALVFLLESKHAALSAKRLP